LLVERVGPMTALDQSRQTAVLASEADSNSFQESTFQPMPTTGPAGGDRLQRLNSDTLLGIAEWHERRALDHVRFARNSEPSLWLASCERRVYFHRMIGDYLRALHINLLRMPEIVLEVERELPFADSTSVAPNGHVD